jgi:hypothetical protein
VGWARAAPVAPEDRPAAFVAGVELELLLPQAALSADTAAADSINETFRSVIVLSMQSPPRELP